MWENLVQFFISQESKLVNLQSLRFKLGIIKENSQWGKKYFPSKSVRFKKSDFIKNEGLSDESEEDFVYDDKLEEKSFNCDSFVNDPREKGGPIISTYLYLKSTHIFYLFKIHSFC